MTLFNCLDGFVGERQLVSRASFPRLKDAIGRKFLDAGIVLLIERRVEIPHHDVQRVVQDGSSSVTGQGKLLITPACDWLGNDAPKGKRPVKPNVPRCEPDAAMFFGRRRCLRSNAKRPNASYRECLPASAARARLRKAQMISRDPALPSPLDSSAG